MYDVQKLHREQMRKSGRISIDRLVEEENIKRERKHKGKNYVTQVGVKIPEGYDPRKDGIAIWDEACEEGKARLTHLAGVANDLLCSKPNAGEELRQWRKLGKYLLETTFFVADVILAQQQVLGNYLSDNPTNSNKKWSKEQDELLIEMVCEGESSVIEIATTMGRTPSAIKTRVSQLVGLKRIEQEVAGRFVGAINGIKSDVVIEGKLIKE